MATKKGYFGQFGGQFVPEFLYSALFSLEQAFNQAKKDREFKKELARLLTQFAGRPTPLYFAKNLSNYLGFKVYLKREDLALGGSHKINNALGQALLAKYMGKKKIVTETAAGMHGLATTMACNVMGIKPCVFMGVKDIKRQSINAEKIKLLGGEVIPVTRGNGVLKDAVSESLVAWIRDLPNAHYLLGSSVGPHPYPAIVAYFQKVIGEETGKQILNFEKRLPRVIIACGSGGSNALGIFQAFIDDEVELVFVEGGFTSSPKRGSTSLGGHAAAFSFGSLGIFQGTKTYVLQDKFGMDRKTESRGVGLNYPARGPQLSYLYDLGRIKAVFANEDDVLEAFYKTAQLEGLIPALETCHALVYLLKQKGVYKKEDVIILNFSGSGEKDLEVAKQLLQIRSTKSEILNKLQILNSNVPNSLEFGKL